MPSTRPSFRPLKSPLQLLPRRHYHSPFFAPPPAPYPASEAAILAASIDHVPSLGFTSHALGRGARDAGYLEVSAQLFPRGAFEMVVFHLGRERGRLAERMNAWEEEGNGEGEGKTKRVEGESGVRGRVRKLVVERLRANVRAGVAGRWGEAIALMAMPAHVSTSLQELARLSDEIWYLSGDTSVDTSWYTKRASLASVYAASEVFMTQDQSTDYRDTEQFVSDRLKDMRTMGSWVGNTMEWVGYTGWAGVNLLRSKGFRI
ncbi:MAG: Ubiquinone biosynthesis protein coq9, mitochondrial [Bathelium mastoideum]|nr:MAG: Ubiquinone biosynthesis protein coq9, mitochondrial [Bathelium mastoideum]KAI9685760.1 MAG: Ubiquinone biosynthesis protein coq9, mitochondrial [Bathelium mastoideum]